MEVPCPRHYKAGQDAGPHALGENPNCGCCWGTCDRCKTAQTAPGDGASAKNPAGGSKGEGASNKREEADRTENIPQRSSAIPQRSSKPRTVGHGSTTQDLTRKPNKRGRGGGALGGHTEKEKEMLMEVASAEAKMENKRLRQTLVDRGEDPDEILRRADGKEKGTHARRG